MKSPDYAEENGFVTPIQLKGKLLSGDMSPKSMADLSPSIPAESAASDNTSRKLDVPDVILFERSSRGMTKHGVKTTKIDPKSVAVLDGRVLIKIDGEIDKRCSAVKQGLVSFKEDGSLDTSKKSSPLFSSNELQTLSTAACHIVSFEVINALCTLHDVTFTKESFDQTVRSMNKDDNLPLKSTVGNMSGTYHMKDKGDRSLDQEIIQAFKTGTVLSDAAAARARRQIFLLLGSKGQMPQHLLEKAREVYSHVSLYARTPSLPALRTR